MQQIPRKKCATKGCRNRAKRVGYFNGKPIERHCGGCYALLWAAGVLPDVEPLALKPQPRRRATVESEG
jgi:hypothetical protein